MTTDKKAQRLLELSDKLNAEEWTSAGNLVFELNSGDYIAEIADHFLKDEICDYIAESRTLAPEIARAYLELRAAVEEFLDADNELMLANGRPPDDASSESDVYTYMATLARHEAALSTLKEKVG